MKIRNPRVIRTISWLGTQAVRALVRSLRVEYRHLGAAYLPPPDEPWPRCIYLVWHEYLILPTFYFARPNLTALISSHADGQLLAGAMRALGMGVVSGSTNRGGVEAVRQIIRDVSGHRHLAITPDGPRGPRRVVQAGAIYLAAKTGMPIVPVGVGYQRPWRLQSWDRFAIPRATFRAKVITAEPFAIPKPVRTDSLEGHRLEIQAEMDRLTQMAEHWAETNRFVGLPGDGSTWGAPV